MNFEQFLVNLWNGLLNFAVAYGFKILGTLLILLIGPFVIKCIIKTVSKGKKFNKLDRNTQTLIIDIIKVSLYVLLAAIITANIGIPAATIAAVIASCGLVIGLALQGSLSNFAGGIMILVFKPFRIGDCIETGSYLGTVTDIGIFYTSITTFDNKVVTIPNGTISNSSVIDYSTNELRRVDLKIRIALDSDIELAKETLHDLADMHELVIHEDPDHPIFVRIGEQTEDALVIYFRTWVKNVDYWTVYFDLLEASKQIFDGRGITIPYKQLDVHINNGDNTEK
ncbi:MAG: mechanosensitive ion channel family protein [Ruminococcaceae bacterium]|nr:mechanosensitive ion channel family protein [Oscillospiraceae bacterium]